MSEERESLSFWAGIVAAPLVLALIAATILYGGFALQQLWNWFAPPFTSVRLTLPEAIGLTSLLSHLKGYRYRKSDDGFRPLGYLLTGITLSLVIGLAAHMASAS